MDNQEEKKDEPMLGRDGEVPTKHFGVLSTLTNQDSHGSPRNMPDRSVGEDLFPPQRTLLTAEQETEWERAWGVGGTAIPTTTSTEDDERVLAGLVAEVNHRNQQLESSEEFQETLRKMRVNAENNGLHQEPVASSEFQALVKKAVDNQPEPAFTVQQGDIPPPQPEAMAELMSMNQVMPSDTSMNDSPGTTLITAAGVREYEGVWARTEAVQQDPPEMEEVYRSFGRGMPHTPTPPSWWEKFKVNVKAFFLKFFNKK